jgi:hypothetical protein
MGNGNNFSVSRLLRLLRLGGPSALLIKENKTDEPTPYNRFSMYLI